MVRIASIEGLRAYLALWVMVAHILGVSGFTTQDLPGPLSIFRSGGYAVDIFVIISGFVIFFLLDHRREAYAPFLTRRFFRLWPLFMLLFAVGIPFSLVRLHNAEIFQQLYGVGEFGEIEIRVASWWEHLWAHVALHVPMVHGMIPEKVLPYTPVAFLGPAWSVSLEWQFYVIAPLAFAWAAGGGPRWRLWAMCLASAGLYAASFFMPKVDSGAFLPMHANYFFIGGASYLFLRKTIASGRSVRFLPIGIAVTAFCLLLTAIDRDMLPLAVWVAFFALLLDITRLPAVGVRRRLAHVFEHPFILYLGKISYSFYLSHLLVIIACQYLILWLLPELPRSAHIALLAISAFAVTIAASHVLFHSIERPGMAAGRFLAEKFSRRPASQEG